MPLSNVSDPGNLELKVLDAHTGIAHESSWFSVEYCGRQHRVPMFCFQETEPTPATISCVYDKARLVQCIDVLFGRFYPDPAKPYIFRVRERRRNYYEVEDPRIVARNEKERVYHKLYTNGIRQELRKGQTISCNIVRKEGRRLVLRLGDAEPNRIGFHDMDSLFGTDDAYLRARLDMMLGEGFMADARKLYGKRDGRWVFLFARVMERAVYYLLEDAGKDRMDHVYGFCNGWLELVVRSGFMANMSKSESEAYNGDLVESIEVCDDFLDAFENDASDLGRKVAGYVASLDPGIYQYRPGRRLRFLYTSFIADFDLLKANIDAMLDRFKAMGEERCREGSVCVALRYILKLYVDQASRDVEASVSRESADTATIRRCVLSLCYLTRVMYGENDPLAPLYASRMYQLLALSNMPEEEVRKLLRNSYNVLFSRTRPVSNYSWEQLEDVVHSQSYVFCYENIMVDEDRHLVYDNGDTRLDMSSSRISMAPIGTPDGETVCFTLPTGLPVSLPYVKAFSRLEREGNFLEVQNTWKEVGDAVLAPARVIRPRKGVLVDGDDADIYITRILDPSRAMCRTVDFDEEGEISLGSLLFYNRPELALEDYCGDDGSPLLFKATYRHRNGRNAFDAGKFKLELARDMLSRGPATCYVISVSVAKDSCLAVTEDGFFLNFPAVRDGDGKDRVKKGDFVDVTVNGVRPNGFGDAEYDGPAKRVFDNRNTYFEYLGVLNEFLYGRQETVASHRPGMVEAKAPALPAGHLPIPKGYVGIVTGMLNKASGLARDPRHRFGCLFICDMMSGLVQDLEARAMFSIRMKYARALYAFAHGNSILEADVRQFLADTDSRADLKEVRGMRNVVGILGKFRRVAGQDCLDGKLLGFFRGEATTLERELSRLVLSYNMLADFMNKPIEDQLLDELGRMLRIDIIKPKTVRIGLEEGETVEFKASMVFPPNNGGKEDIEQQSYNICRVVEAMRNNEGGTLYIGVNDSGYVIGLRNDLAYFARTCHVTEADAPDRFRVHFSNLMTREFGPVNAARIKGSFERRDEYDVFRVDIPKMPSENGSFMRVGPTCQRLR